MFTIEIDGADVVVRNVTVTCFGGDYDTGDNGETESGVRTRGNPGIMGCALPIRSTEAATRRSPLANACKPHIPWLTEVHFWGNGIPESDPVICRLLDNGPDVSRYPTHAGDLTPAAAAKFAPHIPLERIANEFEATLSYRIIGGAQYV